MHDSTEDNKKVEKTKSTLVYDIRQHSIEAEFSMNWVMFVFATEIYS
jgi:hypothetical protein